MILSLILALVFVLLKISNKINWPWWYIVFTPLAALTFIGLIVLTGCVLAFGFKALFVGLLLLTLVFYL